MLAQRSKSRKDFMARYMSTKYGYQLISRITFFVAVLTVYYVAKGPVDPATGGMAFLEKNQAARMLLQSNTSTEPATTTVPSSTTTTVVQIAASCKADGSLNCPNGRQSCIDGKCYFPDCKGKLSCGADRPCECNKITGTSMTNNPCCDCTICRLESTCLLECSHSSRDLLTVEQIRNGGVILYILGTIYLFVALSIVCDEFFVPYLEIVAEQGNVSNEVAGATLMAAGGSAPELFTSLIGTFQESSVGFATIVGSAVFNVLFVVAMCALFSVEVLELSWWPLFRDSICYFISLITLAVFFSYNSPDVIEWWEAFVLFIMYLFYVLLMANHIKVYNFIQRCRGEPEAVVERRDSEKKEENDEELKELTENPGNEEDEQKDDKDEEKDDKVPVTSLKQIDDNCTLSQKVIRARKQSAMDDLEGHVFLNQPKSFVRPSTFRAGIMQLMIKDKPLLDTAGVKVVYQIQGTALETFEKLDVNGDGCIDKEELKALLDSLNDRPDHTTEEEVAKVHAILDKNGDGKITFDEFQAYYIKSEERIEAELRVTFNKLDRDLSGDIDQKEALLLLAQMNNLNMSIDQIEKDANDMWDSLGKKAGENVTFDEFRVWYMSSDYWQEKINQVEAEAEEADGISLKFPEGCRARVIYLLLAPLTYSLVYTLPPFGCFKNGPRWRKMKWGVIGFILAIVWIGIYSFVMVWLIEIAGATLQIPIDVMGVTFLAAGTSVPDLLSSVIVAKMGEGDMAVSSSLGSNIFDVLVGLPFPWLMYCAIMDKSVQVEAGNISKSILILVGMLAAVILIIAMSGWKMSKTLGWAMFVLYFAFLAEFLWAYYSA